MVGDTVWLRVGLLFIQKVLDGVQVSAVCRTVKYIYTKHGKKKHLACLFGRCVHQRSVVMLELETNKLELLTHSKYRVSSGAIMFPLIETQELKPGKSVPKGNTMFVDRVSNSDLRIIRRFE